MRCPRLADTFLYVLENTELSLESATSFCRIKGSEKVLSGQEVLGGFCLLENKRLLMQHIVKLLTSGHDQPGVTVALHLQKKTLSCLHS